MKRSMATYQGFPGFVRALVKLGWMDLEMKEWLTGELTWADAAQR